MGIFRQKSEDERIERETEAWMLWCDEREAADPDFQWWETIPGGPPIQTAEAPGTGYDGTPQEMLEGFAAILGKSVKSCLEDGSLAYLLPLDEDSAREVTAQYL